MPWSWDDFSAAVRQMQAMTASDPDLIDLVVELGGVTIPREDMAPFVPIRDALRTMPDNRGLIVIVAAPLYAESIIKRAQALTKDVLDTSGIRVARSSAEAGAMLDEARK